MFGDNPQNEKSEDQNFSINICQYKFLIVFRYLLLKVIVVSWGHFKKNHNLNIPEVLPVQVLDTPLHETNIYLKTFLPNDESKIFLGLVESLRNRILLCNLK